MPKTTDTHRVLNHIAYERKRFIDEGVGVFSRFLFFGAGLCARGAYGRLWRRDFIRAAGVRYVVSTYADAMRLDWGGRVSKNALATSKNGELAQGIVDRVLERPQKKSRV